MSGRLSLHRGVGVVDPDGDRSARSGAACYAGSNTDLAQPSSRPDKQIGLCGQTGVGYYLACPGKSFDSINSGVKYTSYEVAKPKIAHQKRPQQYSTVRIALCFLMPHRPD